MSHRPLDQLTKEKAIADRARYATKKHHIKPDTIDNLDGGIGGAAFHHGGPYDPTLAARNNSYLRSPVQAVAASNNETLKATPKEMIQDSLERHRPLDGVAAYPPGHTDQNGHVYHYEAGENMMTDLNPEGGAYKRWPGVQYHPDDIKGKGEPSYSIEKQLKDHRISGPRDGEDATTQGIELQSRTMNGSSAYQPESYGLDDQRRMDRKGSVGKRLSGSIKRRIGSIRNRDNDE